MKDLLEEANKMLKTLTSSTSPTSMSRTSTKEGEERNEVVARLPEQLNSLRQKSFKVHRLAHGGEQGLIDSGATNPLRPGRPGEMVEHYNQVSVTVADGGGVMLTDSPDVEPIVPMGHLVKTLQCTVEWKEGGVRVLHPVRGEIQVKCAEGCPQISRSLALELIQEIVDAKQGIKEKGMTFQGEVSWMKELVETHPILKSLLKAIKDGLIVEPGDWRNLPGNRRLKKKLKRDGVVVHLYAGEEEGFSLTRSFQQQGGETWRLMEIAF